MKISIFGLGYVGCVAAACLAKQGHTVIGVDVVPEKVESIQSGKWPIYEPGLDELGVLGTDAFKATSDPEYALLNTEISLVCVGTPSLPDGSVDTTYLERSVANIVAGLKKKETDHILLIRSTVPPGTLESKILPLFDDEAEAKRKVAFCPEFLREGVAIKDFFTPSINVIGADPSFDPSIMKKFLPEVDVPLQVVSIRAAEAIKYANNTFHALKIVFTNELARILTQYDVDAEEVMDVFCTDTTLNLSRYYMRPGFAYGGSCLPKELRGVSSLGKAKGVDPILFDAIVRSNDEMITATISLIYSFKPESVGYFGVTFKPDTDDLRESAVMHVVDAILKRNRSYSNRLTQYVCDGPNVTARMAERASDDILPAADPDELIEKADVIVLAPFKIDEDQQKKLVASGKPVIDLKWFKVTDELKNSDNYHTLV
ncbi:MAG: nucleotide sugar dehydrogenase [Candidatus Lindowbacteria bacterium]|nr:nucleotide sugar dehydrogenase [Candidatus Lindowbacteria bacterium]